MHQKFHTALDRFTNAATRLAEDYATSAINMVQRTFPESSIIKAISRFRRETKEHEPHDIDGVFQKGPLHLALYRLTRAFCESLPSRLPTITRSNRWVNGRGQILTSDGRTTIDLSNELSEFFHAPTRPPEVSAAVAAFRAEPIVWRAHECVNDQGLGYIQQIDTDEAAITNYLLRPFLFAYITATEGGRFSNATFWPFCNQVLDALTDEMVAKQLCTPVLGIEAIDVPLVLGPDVILRKMTDDEREDWSCDGAIEESLVRDVLSAECVIEVRYQSSWARDLRDEIRVQSLWMSDGFDDALRKTDHALAAIRIFTGRMLPVVFSEVRTQALPWVKNKLYHRPTLEDIHRRFQTSPLFIHTVVAEPLAAGEQLDVAAFVQTVLATAELDEKLQMALWVFNDGRSFVNLYKCYEIVLSSVGGRVNNWVPKPDIKRFAHTANSPSAIGYLWARHGSERGDPPAEPMSLEDADALVRKLIVSWLNDSRAAQGDT